MTRLVLWLISQNSGLMMTTSSVPAVPHMRFGLSLFHPNFERKRRISVSRAVLKAIAAMSDLALSKELVVAEPNLNAGWAMGRF